MAGYEVHLELLLSRRVFGVAGRPVGRIEEIRGEMRESECVVTDYLIGRFATFERLSASMIGRIVLRLLMPRRSRGYVVPWNQMDLSDPERPRLRCKVEDLEPLKVKQKST